MSTSPCGNICGFSNRSSVEAAMSGRSCEHFMDDSFLNLGEEVILTLLWQSGASESAICFVIISTCYWLLCMCVRAREREIETVTSQRSAQRVRNHLNRGLFANTYEHPPCVCHVTLFPSRAWTDDKTKDIINCLYIYFESWSSRL